MKVLLDCDVLLDVGTERQPFAVDSGRVLDWCQAHPGSTFVAWHTIANLFYMLQRGGNGGAARQFIHDLLIFADVVPAGSAGVKHALALPMQDFEDAMQCAAAVHAGADLVITRDTSDYRGSAVPAILPADFLAQV